MTSTLQLNVWYEGAKIEVGKSYNPNDIIIYLICPNKDLKRIPWEQCSVNSYKVTKEGLNWYTITYETNSIKLTQQFFVEGVIYKDYMDLNFKVLYVSNETQEDLTDEFKSKLTVHGHFSIGWNHFLNIVNDIKKYGLYIVTVPKATGLVNQYDTEWEVLCTNKTTLKASIKKIYNKEETENGKS